jgi:hypothetical protein
MRIGDLKLSITVQSHTPVVIAQRFSDGQIAWETPLPVPLELFINPEVEITPLSDSRLRVKVLVDGSEFILSVDDGHIMK